MFTVDQRGRLRDELVAAAEADERIAGAALTGSGAAGAEDRWSDIDLAFGLAPGASVDDVIAAWTATMYGEYGAVHHLDVRRHATVYRVYFLASTLQVDIAFAPADEFGAIAPTFKLLFGSAREQEAVLAPDPVELIGMAWLHALHARSSIARERPWQAEHMISGVRDHVLALACLRHDVPAMQGRGLDRLPAEATAGPAAALVRSFDPAELRRAFDAAVDSLLAEVGHVDAVLRDRLDEPLRALLV